MGCASCGTNKEGGLPTGCKNNGWCKSGTGCGSILDVHDWLSNVYYIDGVVRHPIVEVKFKGTRKEYFRNAGMFDLEIGDPVVVESSTGGWDMGYVSLTGELVKLQMKKYRIDEDSQQMKKIIRKATESDEKKAIEAKDMEQETMMQARRFAMALGLVMKISDVEYQGDKSKATFFYTAEGRVDFRELIKQYAKEFRIKIEMRQIGLRQEAGRLGGIGSCGRELCCSTWLTDFHSVPTTAARYQNLFLNPLKLSGQCGRLKCCLNYELDTYLEALEEFPDENTVLKTERGLARVEKIDILKRIMWLKYDDKAATKFYPLDIKTVKHVINLNKEGKFPPDLDEFQASSEMVEETQDFKDVVGEERLDRFDRQKKKKRPNNNRREGNSPSNNNRGNNPAQGNNAPQSVGANNPTQGNNVPRSNPNRDNPNPRQNTGNNPNQGNRNQRPNPGNNPNQGKNNPRPNAGNNPNQGNNNPRPDNSNRGNDQNRNNNSPVNRHEGNNKPQNRPQGNTPPPEQK